MHFRVWSVVFVVALVAIMNTGQFAPDVVANPLNFTHGVSLAIGDNDDDGLPDDLDPDDDNDGIVDNQDAAPFDPLVPDTDVNTPPDANAPDQDTDGDSIPNDLDPDDDNDGSVDGTNNPPPSLPSTLPTAPVRQSPDPVATEHTANAESSSSPANTAPMVTALPATGSGGGSVSASVMDVLLGATLLAVFSAVMVQTRPER